MFRAKSEELQPTFSSSSATLLIVRFTPYRISLRPRTRLLRHSFPPWSEMTLKGGVIFIANRVLETDRSGSQRVAFGLWHSLSGRNRPSRRDTYFRFQMPLYSYFKKKKPPPCPGSGFIIFGGYQLFGLVSLNLLGQQIHHARDDEQSDGGHFHTAGVPPQMFSLSILNHLLRSK